MTTMPENLHMDWVDSVKVVYKCLTKFWIVEICNVPYILFLAYPNLQHVFEYFTERTPRSHFELRETSLVWNYKYAGDDLSLPIFQKYLFIIQYVLKLLNFYSCLLTISSDVEFGRLQAKDLLQHLWTGPISNASVDVVQGSRSVEVRAIGVTKVWLFPFFFLLVLGEIANWFQNVA